MEYRYLFAENFLKKEREDKELTHYSRIEKKIYLCGNSLA